jgi:uncharacterized protein
MAMNQTSPPCIGIGLRHPHYAAVFEQRPSLDFLEVHAENFFARGGAVAQVLDQAAQLYPISLHGVGLSLGSASGIDDWHLQQLKRLVDRIQPMLVSDHACFGRAMLGSAGAQTPAHANDLLPIRHTASSLEVLCANVAQVQDTLKRRIAVENISAYLQWNEADYSEPDFLNALTQRTGCGVLMDLNNIYVNALNDAALKPTALVSCSAWIDAIRADSVMEIHLAGFTPSNALVIDDHATPVHEPVWHLYQHAINKLGNIPTLIEWDLELPELPVLLAEAATARRYALGASS